MVFHSLFVIVTTSGERPEHLRSIRKNVISKLFFSQRLDLSRFDQKISLEMFGIPWKYLAPLEDAP